MLFKALLSFLRILLTFTRPLSNVLLNGIYFIIMGRKKPLPPIRNKILLLSATELAECIRKRKLTAQDVMAAYIIRIKQVNPTINAYVDQRFELAMEDARAVDMFLESGSKTEVELASEMPLLGVPFSCKEMIGVKDLAQTNGLLSFKDRTSPSDADVVTRYKEAGAIPVVVTNVPTMAMWWETSNFVFGRTLSPYDNRRTVGGSSGGEGALLASAGAVIGIGDDLGGSIRVPSAFCGVYGHKPSRGVISNQRPWPVVNEKHDHLWSTGPMCRYAQDLSLLVRLLSGDDAHKLRLDQKVDFRKVKIYYMEELPGLVFSATSDVKAAVRKAVHYFKENFDNSASTLKLEEMRYAFDIWLYKFLEADGPPLRKALESEGKKINWYWELVKSMFHRSDYDVPITFFAAIEKSDKDTYYYKCLHIYQELRRKLEDILAGDAILLLPTHPEPAPHIMTTIPKFDNVGYTCIFNVLGYAVTNIPAGMSQGVPIGLQAVATQYKDRLTLAAAVELDKVFKGWKCPGVIDV